MNDKSEILFESNTIVAINKPSGVLSVPDRYNEDRFSLARWILSLHPDARPLHRLDFETSGIMLFCKKPEAFGWYSDQFEKRSISKTYLAIVEGRCLLDEGMIDQPLFTQSNEKVIISKRGKPSQTQWTLIERFLHHSMIAANPLTGRTHQIRVHLSSMGHPIVGDVDYGASGPFYLSTLKGRHKYRLGKDQEEEHPLMSRVALHAFTIEFIDLDSKKAVLVEAPLPKDMRVVVQKLKQYSPIIR